MQMNELKVMDLKDLRGKFSETSEKYFKLKFEGFTAGIKKPHLLKSYKREMARIKTAMRQKSES